MRGWETCSQKTGSEEVVGSRVLGFFFFFPLFFFSFSPPLPCFYKSSYFILLERRVGVGFTELFFASTASLKNLKMDGKLFQEVNSWRSVPGKYKGDSVTRGRLAAADPINRIPESQNPSMAGVGRDLCGSPSPTPLPKQGHP